MCYGASVKVGLGSFSISHLYRQSQRNADSRERREDILGIIIIIVIMITCYYCLFFFLLFLINGQKQPFAASFLNRRTVVAH